MGFSRMVMVPALWPRIILLTCLHADTVNSDDRQWPRRVTEPSHAHSTTMCGNHHGSTVMYWAHASAQTSDPAKQVPKRTVYVASKGKSHMDLVYSESVSRSLTPTSSPESPRSSSCARNVKGCRRQSPCVVVIQHVTPNAEPWAAIHPQPSVSLCHEHAGFLPMDLRRQYGSCSHYRNCICRDRQRRALHPIHAAHPGRTGAPWRGFDDCHLMGPGLGSPSWRAVAAMEAAIEECAEQFADLKMRFPNTLTTGKA